MISKNKSIGRKIYYLPGLISLIFLPIIFLRIPQPSTRSFATLNYAVPYHAKEETDIPSFSGQYLLKTIRKKQIISFYLDEDHKLNTKKITVIQSEALKLKFECDINHVIAVHFSDSLNYGEFVYLLNMMALDNHKRYAEWKNIFYIFGEDPPDPENEIEPIYL